MNKINKAKKYIEQSLYKEAQRILEPLARDELAEAQYLLGYLFFTAADVSWKESEKWLRAAAEQDYPDAISILALQGHDKKRDILPEENRMMLRKAAQFGSTRAQNRLGCYLCRGILGFQQDEIEGRYWYLEAAKQGHTEAQYNVGNKYLLGEGGEKDIQQAIYWFEKSAVSKKFHPSSVLAAKLLSDIFEKGLYGMAEDPEKARFWSERMAELDRILKEKAGFGEEFMMKRKGKNWYHPPLRCSFCQATQKDRKLIAGPGVCICHECVRQFASEEGYTSEKSVNVDTDQSLKKFCSFCKKSWNEVDMLFKGPERSICNECMTLCIGIIEEDIQP